VDTAHPEGSTGMVDAVLALKYDANAFTVSAADVQLGTVLQSGSGWQLKSEVNAQSGQIGIEVFSNTPIRTTAGGSLVTITLHPRTTDESSSPLTIVPIVDPAGGAHVYQTALSDAHGEFVVHTAMGSGQATVNNDIGAPSIAYGQAATDGVAEVEQTFAAFGHLASETAPIVGSPEPTAVVKALAADVDPNQMEAIDSWQCSEHFSTGVRDLALLQLPTTTTQSDSGLQDFLAIPSQNSLPSQLLLVADSPVEELFEIESMNPA
jgi:hypothetical protein